MNKEERQKQLEYAFAKFAAEYQQSALALITGLFVGLLEYSVEEQGGDKTQKIKIEGCCKRDITIHAVNHSDICPVCGWRSQDEDIETLRSALRDIGDWEVRGQAVADIWDKCEGAGAWQRLLGA